MTTYTLTVTDARGADRTTVHALTADAALAYVRGMEGVSLTVAEALVAGAVADGWAMTQHASAAFLGRLVLRAEPEAPRYALRYDDQETARIYDRAEAVEALTDALGTREAFRAIVEADASGYARVPAGLNPGAVVEALGEAWGPSYVPASRRAGLTEGTRVEAVEGTGWGHDYVVRGYVVEATAARVVVRKTDGSGTVEGDPATMALVWHPVADSTEPAQGPAEALTEADGHARGTEAPAAAAGTAPSAQPSHRADVDGAPLDRYAAARWAGHHGRRFTDAGGRVWRTEPDAYGRTVYTRPAVDGGRYVLDGHGAGRMRWTVQHVPAGATYAATYADPTVWSGMTDSRAEAAAWAAQHDRGIVAAADPVARLAEAVEAYTEPEPAERTAAQPEAVAALAEALAAEAPSPADAEALTEHAEAHRRHGATLAFHADGERCDRATTTADCPRSHDYRTAASLAVEAAQVLGVNDAERAADPAAADHDGTTPALAWAALLGMTAADVADAVRHGAGGVTAEPEALAWMTEHATATLAHYRGAAATWAADHGHAEARLTGETVHAARARLDACAGTAHRLGAVGTAVVWQGLAATAAEYGRMLGRYDRQTDAHQASPLNGEWADGLNPQAVTAEAVRILADGDAERATEIRATLSAADVDALADAWEDAYAAEAPSTEA